MSVQGQQTNKIICRGIFSFKIKKKYLVLKITGEGKLEVHVHISDRFNVILNQGTIFFQRYSHTQISWQMKKKLEKTLGTLT